MNKQQNKFSPLRYLYRIIYLSIIVLPIVMPKSAIANEILNLDNTDTEERPTKVVKSGIGFGISLGFYTGFENFNEIESLSRAEDGTVVVQNIRDKTLGLYFDLSYPLTGCFFGSLDSCRSGPYAAVQMGRQEELFKFGGWSAGWMFRFKKYKLGVGYVVRNGLRILETNTNTMRLESRVDDFTGLVIMIGWFIDRD